MLIQLHSQATTTPKVRAAIQASAEHESALAERFGTTEQKLKGPLKFYKCAPLKTGDYRITHTVLPAKLGHR